MARLVPIDPDKHADLKVSKNRDVEFAASRHLLALQATEISQAISSFPVLISRVHDQGRYAISALTAFEPGQNLFVNNGEWDAPFQSGQMQTFPLFLMQAQDGSDKPDIGLYEDANAINAESGDSLIVKGKPSLWTQQIEKRLLQDAQRSILTDRFLTTLDETGLLKPVDLVLHISGGESNRIKGLFVINEDKLQQISDKEFKGLREKGYLAPIYAMLFSIFQFNNLIRRHNAQKNIETLIERVSIEISKDQHV